MLKVSFDSKTALPKNGFQNFEFKNDSVKIEFLFSDALKLPAFQFVVTNLTDKPVFIDWEKSIIETTEAKFPLYQEGLVQNVATPAMSVKKEIILPYSTAASLPKAIYKVDYLSYNQLEEIRTNSNLKVLNYAPFDSPENIQIAIAIHFEQENNGTTNKYYLFHFYLSSIEKLNKKQRKNIYTTGGSFYLLPK